MCIRGLINWSDWYQFNSCVVKKVERACMLHVFCSVHTNNAWSDKMFLAFKVRARTDTHTHTQLDSKNYFCIATVFVNVCVCIAGAYMIAYWEGPVAKYICTKIVSIRKIVIGKGKDKAVPLQAWNDPEGSRKLSFPDYMTTAQDGDKFVSLTHRPAFTPGKYSWYSFLLEAESTPGPLCDRRDYVNKKFEWHHLESNQRPSDL